MKHLQNLFLMFAFSASVTCGAAAAAPAKEPVWTGDEGGANAKNAAITWFVPEKPNGNAVVICPGGAYGMLCSSYEGVDTAKWLNQFGITGVMLEYRIAPNKHPLPLRDAARAIRLVRRDDAKHGLKLNKVGIMGFSAGGHLASTLATHYDAGDPKAVNTADRLSSRPDFQILIYPVITMGEKTENGTRRNLLGQAPAKDLLDFLSNEKQITDKTPEAFLCHSIKDQLVSVENSRMYTAALKAHKVPVEYLELQEGGHGLGAGRGPQWKAWQDACRDWLFKQGYAAKPQPPKTETNPETKP